MKDALLVVDVFNDFDHESGDALLESFRERHAGMREAPVAARAAGVPVIYVNDQRSWNGDAPGLVRWAIDESPGGELIAALKPEPDEAFILKPRYSAFDHTPLIVLLRELEIERLLMAGAATEGCVVQSAIDARELGFKVTILADACATNDRELEALALRYAERVGGIFVVGSFADA
jgi:nicotinamidase-related amidase